MTNVPEVPWEVAIAAPGIEVWARQLDQWAQDNLPVIPEPFSLSQDIQDALEGNEGQPSASNRFVTEEGLTNELNITTTTIVTTLFANPTGQVGLTAVNGVATTAMRSDAAPSLDVSISPTWTGTHTFQTSAGVRLGPYGAAAGNTTSIRFYELAANGTSSVAFKSADALAGDVTWTLPSADGGANHYLKTSGAAVLSLAQPQFSEIGGTATVSQGGTGATTLTGMLQGNGTSAVTAITGTADVLPKWSASAPYLTDSLLHSGTDLVEQYNSTNAQSWSLYGSRTSAVVYERMTVVHNGSASGITFTSEAAGGGTVRDFIFSGGKVGIGVAPVRVLDVLGTTIPQFRLRSVVADATQKNGYIGVGHYTNSEEDVAAFVMTSAAASSTIRIGGGSGSMNAVTEIRFYTAGTTTTVDGTQVATIDLNGNFGIRATTFGASMVGGMAMKNGTAPSGNVTDCFQHYAADIVAGNSAPHWRTENGAVVKLFQSTGWTLPTGTASKAGFDTATGTLTNALQTIKAIMDHLLTGCALFAA